MKWFIHCLKNYVNFHDRASRSEYWFYTLFMIIFMIVATAADYLIFGEPNSWLYALTSLFFFLPSLAVWTRRLHDIGRSGWNIFWYYMASLIWVVALIVVAVVSLGLNTLTSGADLAALVMQSIGFLSVVGIGCLGFFVWAIVLFVWLCTKGTAGDNKYGSDPLAK